MKTLAIIGSTGSIGLSSLNVLKKNKKKFKLLYLVANQNYFILKKQIKYFKPSFFYLSNDLFHNKFNKFKNFKSIDYFIKNKIKIDYVISGVSGFESIDLNLNLTKISKNLLIANKETIICGGNYFINVSKKNKCKIIPIDSEHHTIDNFFNNMKNKKDIKKVYLIASGGPFYNSKKIKYNESVKKVLKHPNWKMGKKISVDSSTFANKILELFEAKILFDLKYYQLDILVEQKSNLHSIIEFKNNILYFICHDPNMEIPISNSLNCLNSYKINLTNNNIKTLRPSNHKFPLLKLGFKILKLKNSGMIIFTVVNERLVNLFLNKKIKYGDIVKILINVFKRNSIVKNSNKCIKTLEDIKKTINFAKNINL